MELSQEAYILIARYVGTRGELAALSRVSRGFQRAAERMLYNTLNLRNPTHTMSICRLIATTPRLSILVDAFSITVSEEQSDSDGSPVPLPDDYWNCVAAALKHTLRLRFLSIYLDGVANSAQAWILTDCGFQLRTFHCDFEWDGHLSAFLNSQSQLIDLYITDYKNDSSDATTPSLDPHSLPRLSVLECTFTEAAVALVPGRPIARLKTCFSRSQADEKRAEMITLFTKIRLSRKHLRALDIADSSYTQEFSLELLTSAVNTFSNSHHIRYLGTLVLPVGGRERLEFYGMLMRLSRLQCVEVEVSEWEPPPTSPAALRALTYELRLYCPSVNRIVFVYDFDRVVMKMTDGVCVLDGEANTETLWREV